MSKPAITAAEADRTLARMIETLKAARCQLKGPRPNWDAASQMLGVVQDMNFAVRAPILDILIERHEQRDWSADNV